MMDTTLSVLTPAAIDALWIEALAPTQKKYERANALEATAARYAKAGANWADIAAKKSQDAHELRVEAHAERALAEAPFTAEWKTRGGWTRAYIVPGGHIHKTTACSSLHPTTLISWLPEQSGWDEARIVEAAGVTACTICYPSAPVDALKAALAEAKAKTECPGSRSYDHDSSGLMYYSPRARCNHCHQTISATRTGKLRAHKPKGA